MPRASEYIYAVQWSDEDDAFVCRVLDFPLIATHGSTEEAAIHEALMVVAECLSEMKEAGERPPPPRTYWLRHRLRSTRAPEQL
jgi:predicted RNase H-like HicB family nuclease